MSMDFSQVPEVDDDLIPDGSLVCGQIRLRRDSENALITRESSKTPGNVLLPAYVVVQTHPHRGKFVDDIIVIEGAPKAVAFGRRKIKAILEAANAASARNPDGYIINHYLDLDRMRVVVRVGIDEYNGKKRNVVRDYLTPQVPDQREDFQRLVFDATNRASTNVRQQSQQRTTADSSYSAADPPSWLDAPESEQ